MRSSVAETTLMNEFASCGMQALHLMRRNRQRFTVIDYNQVSTDPDYSITMCPNSSCYTSPLIKMFLTLQARGSFCYTMHTFCIQSYVIIRFEDVSYKSPTYSLTTYDN